MADNNPETGVISGRVVHGADYPIRDAEVRLYVIQEPDVEGRKVRKAREFLGWTKTDDKGAFRFESLSPRKYELECTAFGLGRPKQITLEQGCLHPNEVVLRLDLELSIEPPQIYMGRTATLKCVTAVTDERLRECTFISDEGDISFVNLDRMEAQLRARRPGRKNIKVYVADRVQGANSELYATATFPLAVTVLEPESTYVSGEVGMQLKRTQVDHTPDQALWSAIRLHTRRIGFGPYHEFINRVLCGCPVESFGDPSIDDRVRELRDRDKPLHGVKAYDVLRISTEAFLLRNCGVKMGIRDGDRRFFHRDSESARLGEPVSFEFVQLKLREYLGSSDQLPYITRVIEDAFPWAEDGDDDCDNVLTCRRLNQPCLIELIWSYWHEEGMLAQAMNAIARRFQNLRSRGRDPLSNLEIDPLRPLNNILWGFIQDEFRRLTVKRRAYEYEHHYGLTLYGRALSHMRPADSRSKFLEAFHHLLHLSAIFYKEDNDTTVIADGYPLLHALKEVHLVLAQGAQNQFGDLPWTARAEMLLQQWMLARPEVRDFLQSRAMVPYQEAWMPQVDSMKTLQGWSDITVTHFRDLGVYGEQILLSVRYGDWVAINDEDSAKNWARYWRPEIQGYLHAYRAATGIDLTHSDTVDTTLPSIHLQNRLAAQQQRLR